MWIPISVITVVHLILAQAALESGWGQRQIRRENGEPSYNLFGVKASGPFQLPEAYTITGYKGKSAAVIADVAFDFSRTVGALK